MEESKNIVLSEDDFSNQILSMENICARLIKTAHYAKFGSDGIYAIVTSAKTLGIDPFVALDGGLYYVKGKVEMSARMMNSRIREKKHSITKDRKSDDEICILHGKRADNGDTWTESFSMQDAQKAGLDKNPVWRNFARDMLFARALSRLAKQLFPDVIGNVYVEGEISLDPNISKDTKSTPAIRTVAIEEQLTLTDEQYDKLTAILKDNPELAITVNNVLVQKQITDIRNVPINWYDRIVSLANEKSPQVTNE